MRVYRIECGNVCVFFVFVFMLLLGVRHGSLGLVPHVTKISEKQLYIICTIFLRVLFESICALYFDVISLSVFMYVCIYV